MKNKALYSFNWIGGGFNYVYAHTKTQAIKQIAKEFPNDDARCIPLLPDVATLKRHTDEAIDKYFRDMPRFD